MIRGQTLDLRAIERSDASLVHHWLDDPELMYWWGFGSTAVSLAAIQMRIEQWIADEFQLGHPLAFIAQDFDGTPIGMAMLSDLDSTDRRGEVSLFLEERARGSGRGVDLLDTFCAAAFDDWNLHRLTARCEAHNQAAHDFFLRNGFVLEGRLREARYTSGGWSDILIFGRLRPEGVTP